jgi:hypothetical protein
MYIWNQTSTLPTSLAPGCVNYESSIPSFLFTLLVSPFGHVSSFHNMRSLLLVGVLPLVHGVRIIQSNDDGWAESNVRTLFNTLADAGHDMILSGPAEQNSGRSA